MQNNPGFANGLPLVRSLSAHLHSQLKFTFIHSMWLYFSRSLLVCYLFHLIKEVNIMHEIQKLHHQGHLATILAYLCRTWQKFLQIPRLRKMLNFYKATNEKRTEYKHNHQRTYSKELKFISMPNHK